MSRCITEKFIRCRPDVVIIEKAPWDQIKFIINQYHSVYESDLIEAYDVGMVKFLHARDLSGQQPLGLLIQLGFV